MSKSAIMDPQREYEIQHFGFSSAQISLERKHFIKNIISRTLDGVLEKLIQSSSTLEKLQSKKSEVHEKIINSLNSNFMTLAELDERYFAIPKHVLLLQDFGLTNQLAMDDEKYLDMSIAEIEKSYLESCVLTATLESENTMHESLGAFIKEEINEIELVEASLDSISMKECENIVLSLKTND